MLTICVTFQIMNRERVMIITALRLSALNMVNSLNMTYTKGYFGFLSILGAFLSIIACRATLIVRFFRNRQKRKDGHISKTLNNSAQVHWNFESRSRRNSVTFDHGHLSTQGRSNLGSGFRKNSRMFNHRNWSKIEYIDAFVFDINRELSRQHTGEGRRSFEQDIPLYKQARFKRLRAASI